MHSTNRTHHNKNNGGKNDHVIYEKLTLGKKILWNKWCWLGLWILLLVSSQKWVMVVNTFVKSHSNMVLALRKKEEGFW